MGACREGADIWFAISHRYPGNKEWMGWRLFTHRFWRNPYVWHDSFGKYLHRLYCNHPHTRNVADPGQPFDEYCFTCERHVTVTSLERIA